MEILVRQQRSLEFHNIWSKAKQQINEGTPFHFTSNKQGISHKKQIQIPAAQIKDIPLTKRGTIRKLAVQLAISKSSVGRWVKSGEIKAHTNAIKPELTEVNKLQRLSYSIKALIVYVETKKLKFSEMYDVVHIDEKWFCMTRECERYYMIPDETEPYRSCKSKRFIPKIMFMCDVARPRLTIEGEAEFDGKIGLWPFTREEPAARTSKNRPRGTLVTKPIEFITKEVIKSCLINQIIPAIKAKGPPNASKRIFIQQDNAKPHIGNDDPEFRAAASTDGFNINVKGHNNYKVHHIGKDSMIREGTLPISLEVDEEQVKEGFNFLKHAGLPYGVSYDMSALASVLGL